MNRHQWIHLVDTWLLKAQKLIWKAQVINISLIKNVHATVYRHSVLYYLMDTWSSKVQKLNWNAQVIHVLKQNARATVFRCSVL